MLSLDERMKIAAEFPKIPMKATNRRTNLEIISLIRRSEGITTSSGDSDELSILSGSIS